MILVVPRCDHFYDETYRPRWLEKKHEIPYQLSPLPITLNKLNLQLFSELSQSDCTPGGTSELDYVNQCLVYKTGCIEQLFPTPTDPYFYNAGLLDYDFWIVGSPESY